MITLEEFLSGREGNSKVRVVQRVNAKSKEEVKTLFDEYHPLSKPHLYDVVSWELGMNNYEPIITIKVK